MHACCLATYRLCNIVYGDMYIVAGVSSGSSGPGRANLPLVGSSASWKAVLWTRLDQLVTSIQKAYNQVGILVILV